MWMIHLNIGVGNEAFPTHKRFDSLKIDMKFNVSDHNLSFALTPPFSLIYPPSVTASTATWQNGGVVMGRI